MTRPLSSADQADVSPNQPVGENEATQPTKTPLFEATNADRYQRQALIKTIQTRTQRRLICYVSSNNCSIDSDDIVPFVDLLHNVPRDHALDLLLHTGGGNADTAEKLVRMMRRHAGEAAVRIVVPDFAKSAGTLMVLGADSVVMSDTSELGPIDPQILIGGKWQSVQNYLDAFATHARALETDPNNIAARIMLERIDPVILKLCESLVERVRQAAESLLVRGMFRSGGNYTKTASELLNTRQWLSHGQTITSEDAGDPQIGLTVEHLDYGSQTWQDYWRLYCLQRLAVGQRQKLYESDFASLIIGPAEAT